MIVNSSGKYFTNSSGKTIVNDVANYFLGTVSTAWENTLNWSFGKLPTIGQKAIIAANCVVSNSYTVRSITVLKGVTFSHSTTTTITAGYVKNYGTYNVIQPGSSIIINGLEESAYGNMNFGNAGSIQFNTTTGTITLPNLDYYGVTINGAGVKQLGYDITIRGSLTTQNGTVFNVGNNSLTVNGATTIGGELKKDGSTGNMVFGGVFVWNTNVSKATFTGTFNITYKNGVTGYNNYYGYHIDYGNASVIFSTNNQSIQGSNNTQSNFIFRKPVLIDNITLTNVNNGGAAFFQHYDILDGTTSNSKYIMGANTHHYIGSTTMPMQTGIFDHTTNTSTTVGFISPTAMNIPWTNFANLAFGAGTKTLSSGTIVTGNIVSLANQVIAGGILDLGAGNVTVNGQIITGGGDVQINSSTANLLCKGLLNSYDGKFTVNGTYTPNIELQGGITGYANGGRNVDLGYAVIRMTTNNQAIYGQVAGFSLTIRGSITIENIVVTLASGVTFNSYGTLDGTTSNSKFLMGTNSNFFQYGTNTIMPTGIFDASTNVNNVYYTGTGNQDITNVAYYNLRTQLTGIKRLVGNLVVSNGLFCGNSGGGSYFDPNGYNVTTYAFTSNGFSTNNSVVYNNTLSGTFTIGLGGFTIGGHDGINLPNYTININGALVGGNASAGNPTVAGGTIYLNNVTYAAGNRNTSFIGNSIIKAGTTLTIQGGSALFNSVDGEDSGSKIVNKGRLIWTGTTAKPMQTGTLDLTSFPNTFEYSSAYLQDVFPATYNNLTLTSSAGQVLYKNLVGDIIVTGLTLFQNNACLQLGNYDFIINTLSTSNNTNGGATLARSGSTGQTIFNGLVAVDNANSNKFYISFTGNADIEFRNGIANANSSYFSGVTGTGTWKFTTNNQTISASVNALPGSVLIDNITLTVASSNFNIAGTINGTNSNSVFNNDGRVTLNSSTLPMQTGIFNYKNGGNSTTIAYNYDGDYTLHSFFNGDFGNLVIGGRGKKTLSQNTVISGNLIVGNDLQADVASSNTQLELATYNFQVNGTTILSYGTNRKITRSASTGSTLFIGQLSWDNANGNSTSFDFGVANTVEFRGGTSGGNGTAMNLTSAGTLKFSTNNQSIFTITQGAPNILVSGPITLTYNASTLTINGLLNGDDALSKFDNRNIVTYKAMQQPMLIGILETNAAPNTFNYGRSGDQDIKGGAYRNLTLSGGGDKTLQGNVTKTGTYSELNGSIRVDNGYTFT